MRGVKVEYGTNHALEELLRSIDRPGDFCAHGRFFVPMPRLEVDGAGRLSFAVPEAQVRALIAVAERAPYGRGPDTLVDTSVRDCWQIDSTRVRLSGKTWPDTLAKILDAAAAGLGCPSGRVDAHLYKLLVYETGGFFSPHRDTEKADGMIATLSISLPVTGEGGELIVRHRDREVTVDMNAGEPSELAFAAFYADCTHEIRPVVDGHRLSLVFNLCVRAGDSDTPREAPDYTEQVDEIAKRLVEWRHAGDAAEKLVWLLEHEYSEAGLSFDALKNADAAVASTLARAAERADCELYAAIVHIEEHGDATYEGDYLHGWDTDGIDAEDMEIGELHDSRHWLAGWVSQDGDQPPFGELSLLPEELLPRGALDEAEPDEQWLHEATGNAGVSLERAYRLAALVLWPRSETLTIVAGGGINGVVAWVASELDRNAGIADERIGRLVSGLIDMWPSGGQDRSEPDGRARMLRLLSTTEDRGRTVRFLREVVLRRYGGGENDDLIPALGLLGPEAAKRFLLDLAGSGFTLRPEETLALLRQLGEERSGPVNSDWEEALREGVRAVLLTLAAALSPRTAGDPRGRDTRRPKRLDERAVRELFRLAWRYEVTGEAEAAAHAVAGNPQVVRPDRALPAALRELSGEEGLADGVAFATLWRHATDFLLARSAEPPEEPRDWTIPADVACTCEHCRRLRAFCRDPDANVARFPLRQDLRGHLHQIIERHRLDLDHVTERCGRPYTLVCTKNRATHKRRLAEYAEDVAAMRTLLRSAPGGEQSAICVPDLERLHAAVAASE